METDYTTVTEIPGNKVTQEQLERIFHRYCFAGHFSEGKDVLEIACGAGLGLGYLAKKAKRVVGGDYTENLMKVAKEYYKGRIPLLRLDAHDLPFRDESSDVVILYEAIYYLSQPQVFLEEVRRVLRKEGVLVIATVNRDWAEFNPSPFSTRYFSIPELSDLLRSTGFKVEMYGSFPVLRKGLKGKIISMVRKIAVALDLIPKTMRGKELLKKIFYGKLIHLGGEIEEGMCKYVSPSSISSDHTNHDCKIIYAVARVE